MVLLYLIVAAVLLLSLFLVLTAQEARTGTRFFRTSREALDERLAHLSNMSKRVHFGLVALHVVESFSRQVIRDVIHVSLASVHVIERALMRTVRALASREKSTPVIRARSHFIEAIAHVKKVSRRAPAKKEEIE